MAARSIAGGLPSGPRDRMAQPFHDPYDSRAGSRSTTPSIPQTPRAPPRRDPSPRGLRGDAGRNTRSQTPDPARDRRRDPSRDPSRSAPKSDWAQQPRKPPFRPLDQSTRDRPYAASETGKSSSRYNRDREDDNPTSRRQPRTRELDYDSGPTPADSRPASSSTTSSTASSLLDRMKARSAATSTRTSLDEPSRTTPRTTTGPAGRVVEASPSPDYEDEYSPPSAQQVSDGLGSSLWTRVVTAAGNLTVSVGSAFQAQTQDGEETPPGEDSHLTRAMKAYYLKQARSKTDLPSWLFEDGERRDVPAPSHAQNHDSRGSLSRQDREHSDTRQEPRSRGLRDVYETAARSAAAQTPPTPARSQAPATNTNAASRLKALRDAKRNVAGAHVEEEAEPEALVRGRGVVATGGPRMPPVRVGLPSGPRRM